MVEQTVALLDKDNAELLGGLEHGAVVLAPARGGNVLDAGPGGAEDVVDEGELAGQLIYFKTEGRKGMEKKQWGGRGRGGRGRREEKETYECIRRNGHLAQLGEPALPLLGGERRRHLLKDPLVLGLLGVVARGVAGAEQVDGVALVGALGARLPADVEHAVVEAHPPVVGLVAGQTRAVDAALLAGAQADDLAVQRVAD